MRYTAHVDTFARDNLPPREQWPEFLFELPELRYPGAPELRDRAARPRASRAAGATRSPIARAGRLRWTYAELARARQPHRARAGRGSRRSCPAIACCCARRTARCIAACWFARAEGRRHRRRHDAAAAREGAHRHRHQGADLARAVRRPPRRRARRSRARRARRSRTVAHVRRPTRATASTRSRAAKPATFANVDTAADDTALIAFTSGTTGQAEGHDALPSRRDGGVRLLAALDAARVARRPLHRQPAARVHVRAGRPAAVPAAHRRRDAAASRSRRPNALLPAIARHRVDVLFTAPTSYRAMAAQAREHDLSSLRKCVSAGEALPAATRQAVEGRDRHRDHRRHRRDRDAAHLHFARRGAREARRDRHGRSPATARA